MNQENKQVFCSHCNRYIDNKPKFITDKDMVDWYVCPRCGGYWRKAKDKMSLVREVELG